MSSYVYFLKGCILTNEFFISSFFHVLSPRGFKQGQAEQAMKAQTNRVRSQLFLM